MKILFLVLMGVLKVNGKKIETSLNCDIKISDFKKTKTDRIGSGL